jgi:U3 small nucleolar RNA-associated protein 18
MARTKSTNGVKSKAAGSSKKTAPPSRQQDESASEMSDVELQDYNVPTANHMDNMSQDEKDAAEEELERAVFGDSMGFRAGLAGFEAGGQDIQDSDDHAAAPGDEEQAYDAFADSDLFFSDVGASAALQPAAAVEDDEDEEEEGGAAWQDSDDERMLVSLASVPRLRKLRRTEAEDVISGKDYVRRLRKQYVLVSL